MGPIVSGSMPTTPVHGAVGARVVLAVTRVQEVRAVGDDSLAHEAKVQLTQKLVYEINPNPETGDRNADGRLPWTDTEDCCLAHHDHAAPFDFEDDQRPKLSDPPWKDTGRHLDERA